MNCHFVTEIEFEVEEYKEATKTMGEDYRALALRVGRLYIDSTLCVWMRSWAGGSPGLEQHSLKRAAQPLHSTRRWRWM